ncbi:hypothetical protein MKW92_029860, partial [Papaver armeniacum]
MVGSVGGKKYFPTKDGYLADSQRAKKDTRLNKKRADCVLEEELDWLSQLNKFDETGRVIELDDGVAETAVNEGSITADSVAGVSTRVRDGEVAETTVNEGSKGVNSVAGVSTGVRKVVRKKVASKSGKGVSKGLVHGDVNAGEVHEAVNVGSVAVNVGSVNEEELDWLSQLN